MSLKPLDKLPTEPLHVNRALISVSDKTDIGPLAKALHKHDVEIVSTGGTAAAIRDLGIPVTDVSEVTGEAESLDGRVKTLHPNIHAGILARTSHQPDVDEIKELGVTPFELVVVNLYPFKKTVGKEGVTPAVATENIDIGGPTMVRASAKNFAHVCVLTSPSQYSGFLDEFSGTGKISFEKRREYATRAFSHTADYDAAISHYFNQLENQLFPDQISLSFEKSSDLRYGENPHQKASVYGQ